MANRETTNELSSLAARVLNEKPRQGDEHLSFNALLVQAKKLAGSVLSQDETPGLRQAENAANPRRNDYHPDDTPTERLEKIAGNMKASADHHMESDSVEAFGYTLEGIYQYADHIGEVVKMLARPNAGTTAYEMIAAAETQNVEVTETLIHMVAATVLAKLIDEEGGGRSNITFSPADMDAMHQRYILHATRDGMIATVSIEPRPDFHSILTTSTAPAEGGLAAAPESFYKQDGIDEGEPAEPQAPEHIFDRPLWAARVDGHLFPASDQAQAQGIVGRADVGQIAQVENRFCYHPECPAEHCNRTVNQSALVSEQDDAEDTSNEVTSDVDSPDA